jgi:hypothetical protein
MLQLVAVWRQTGLASDEGIDQTYRWAWGAGWEALADSL